MELVHFINLIFIFVLNVFFFLSGVCLNSVVIISFWRSVQLRKKLCYFMIMVLSCCDLCGVVTNNPVIALVSMLWLTGKLDGHVRWPHLVLRFVVTFQAFSLLALLVMNFDRYLATSYPIFHRKSVTKKRLLTLLITLIIIEMTLAAMSTNDAIISYQVHILIIFVLVTPPMLFINCKLFLLVRINRRNSVSIKKRKTNSSTNISSCLIAVICYLVLLIPVFVYMGIMVKARDTIFIIDRVTIAGMWTETITSLNCSFNCLIFYWKNKVLRIEGYKVLKSIKIYHWTQFQANQ